MSGANLFVILVLAVAFWIPLVGTLTLHARAHGLELRSAFEGLVDEVLEARAGVWPRLVGRLGGRRLALRATLSGWVLELETLAQGGIPSAAHLAGRSGAEEFAALASGLESWENRGRLRLRGGNLQLRFAPEVIADSARLTRCLALLLRARELLERFSGFDAQAERMRCPFCHDALRGAEAVVHCPGCQTPHHESCYAEGGCTLLGCAERGARRHLA